MTPFATPADLRTLMPGLEDGPARLALELVSGAIRDSIGWNVDETVGAVYERVVPPRRGGAAVETVVLPAQHITAVGPVVVDGRTLAMSQYDVTESGIVYLYVPARRRVHITYTAGWRRAPVDAAPAVFRTVALDLAARLADNPTSTNSYRMGLVSEDLTPARDAADTDGRLDAYRVNL
jgi:hypothetical protein